MRLETEHFARVEPIVGAHLRQARVALIGLPLAAPIVTHLAACGVGRWLWADHRPPLRLRSGQAITDHRQPRVDNRALKIEDSYVRASMKRSSILHPRSSVSGELRAYLLAQHGAALHLDLKTAPAKAWPRAVRRVSPDLIIAVGGAAELEMALETAAAARAPALLIIPPTGTISCQAITIFPGEYEDARPTLVASVEHLAGSPQCTPGDWDWITAAPLCAGLARAILLRDTPHRRADLAGLWAAGNRILTIGAPGDPFTTHWSPLTRSSAHPLTRSPCHGFRTPLARRGTLLIAGLGSLGSVAATYLIDHAGGFVLADPDCVDAYNPARQAYPLAAIGRPKAQALREGLLAAGARDVTALEMALTDEHQVAALIEEHNITCALVVTGTAADFAIARALRQHGVPHIVGRCYPRARYWEAIIVDGQAGPALNDLRGHLQLGPTPAPTPEQIAAYSDAGALEAEPATLVESGWAAVWMARLAAQMLAPAGLRERWLLELLAVGQTCILGGAGVEPTPDGPAYGIAQPGEIRAWGRADIR